MKIYDRDFSKINWYVPKITFLLSIRFDNIRLIESPDYVIC